MIYVVKHKPCITPSLEGYEDLNVGKNETLAAFNPYINEITGLYEIWKKPDDIKGLVHYRRFFVENGDYLTLDRASEILDKFDVITTVDYECVPIDLLERNLNKKVIWRYTEQLPMEVDNWLYEPQTYNICNMFVAKKQFVDDYCSWLFPIILPLCEQFIKHNKTNDIKQNRTLGFITECLFGYWCSNANRYKMEVKTL